MDRAKVFSVARLESDGDTAKGAAVLPRKQTKMSGVRWAAQSRWGGDKRRDPRASHDKIDLTGATRDESLPRHRRGVTDPQALEARHDLSCAALAHTEELLDRRRSR